MKEQKDITEQFIKDEFERNVQIEEQDANEDQSVQMSEEQKEDLKEKIQQSIEEIEREELLAKLPEEDRKALELGHKLLEEKEQKVTVIRKKRRGKMYLGLAAVLVLVVAIGITSVGGPEKVMQMFNLGIGDREVEQKITTEKKWISASSKEEEAYEEIKAAFGKEPVKIITLPNGAYFKDIQLNTELKTAELYYEYNNENILYFINDEDDNSAWGIGVEDQLLEEKTKDIQECEIIVKKYLVSETNQNRYTATFNYKGLSYFLIGTMTEEDFGTIINNLYFYNKSR